MRMLFAVGLARNDDGKPIIALVIDDAGNNVHCCSPWAAEQYADMIQKMAAVAKNDIDQLTKKDNKA